MNISVKSLSSLVFTAFLCSCSNSATEASQEVLTVEPHGNVVRIAELTVPSSIFPQKITNAVEGLIASQIYEGLVRINPQDLSIMPGLAESWEVSGKTVTFHLRKGVKFQNTGDAGSDAEITSKDVLFTFEQLCSATPENIHFQTVSENRIAGANEYHAASMKKEKAELKGFKVIDDYTFSIELLTSPAIFLELLANPITAIISEKAFADKKDLSHVGAGPFVLDAKSSTSTHYALYKNKNYYAKDKSGKALPYLDSLIIDILPSSEEALKQFENGNIDLMSSVPSSQVNRLVTENIQSFKNPAKYIVEQKPEMASSYYIYNINKAPFNNVKVRQALNYAIDRNRIIEKVLLGQAYAPAIHGVVPPTFAFYKTNDIKGYDLDVEKAKQLLKEAGYPDGKNFPEVQLVVNSGDSKNNSVAVEIQKQLKTNLNINVTFESVPSAEKFEMENKGSANLFGDAWVADYPNPESFLTPFYGKGVEKDLNKISYPNTTRYQNKAFDTYYEAGRIAGNRDSSVANFLKAEQVLIADAPIMPLWYDSNCRLLKVFVKGFYSNPLRYYDFLRVTIDEKR